jgi:hypothetical protein
MPKMVEACDARGHKGEALLRKTCKRLGVDSMGALKQCKGCGHAKAKAKGASKTATEAVERLFLDTSVRFHLR